MKPQNANLQQAENEALQFLYRQFREHGGISKFNIKPIADCYDISSHDLGLYLFDEDYVQDVFPHENGCSCSISLAGISKVAPNCYAYMLYMAITHAGFEEDWIGVKSSLSILGETQSSFHALDIARIFEENELAELRVEEDEIYINLTAKGREAYKNNIYQPNEFPE